MAETIENNMRKIVVDEQPVNPKYYEEMSELLNALIEERRQKAIAYQEYLAKIKALATQVVRPEGAGTERYPSSMDTRARRNLYDTLDGNEELTIRVDTAVRYTKKDGWTSNRFKEKEVRNAVREELGEYNVNLDDVIGVVKKQDDYQ